MEVEKSTIVPGAKVTFPNRVLCVDDNRDAADSTALLLRTVGFEARACYSGEEALHEAQSYRPHVCFIDLNMPGMNGDELAIRLREQGRRRQVTLVALTATRTSASRMTLPRKPCSSSSTRR